MRTWLWTLSISGLICAGICEAQAADPIRFENTFLELVLGPDGRNVSFLDKATGTDYCTKDPASPVAHVTVAGQNHPASAASFSDGQLTLQFGDSGFGAALAVTVEDEYLLLEVLSVTGGPPDVFTFVDIPLTLAGRLDEPFAGCVLALNLQTNVTEIPGPNARIRAMSYSRFGFEGAKAAIIGCPQDQLRETMKTVVSTADGLPKTDIGGPWALDAAITRGSYLFDFGQCTEETVDDWIALAKRLGMSQIDFHTGRSLRFGDCRPAPDLFPRGRDSVKAVIDKLHAAGMAAGLHTYAFFIAKDTPYVTPVPDPRLGKDATFTLSTDMTVDAATVPVDESTEAMSTTTAFFVRNSVTLQVDDELITYAAISKEPPYAFTECTRGACGTTPAPHTKGAQVHHLKECFGLFTPDAESTLLAEVAANTANTYNECGFDMMYLDALDGEDILAGGENGWHYGSKFVFEIANRIEKPALFEMSTFHHHLWYVRARMGAWDHPNRSHKQFIDMHAAANRSGEKMFLPMNLGWWAVKVWNGARNEPTFPDDIEYLMGKCLGNDMGFALMGVNPGNIGNVPAYQRLAPIFRQYEELRHAGYFSESVKAALRVPGDEFTLEQAPDDSWHLRPVQYAKHKVTAIDGASNVWTTANTFDAQPVRLRIEALMSAATYDAPESVEITAFDGSAETFKDTAFQDGTQASLAASPDVTREGTVSGRYTATSTRDNPNGAWTKVGRVFEPLLNISGQQAMGVWVHGDGQGELLNLQLKSPHHLAGGIGDHYIPIDFTGWRYFELVEHEGGRISDFSWPYGGAYSIYREDVSFGAIESFSLWYNNLPKGKEVTCYLSPVRALPLVAAKLINPAVTVNGQTLTFPVEMEPGQYLEFHSPDDCKLYGRKGELIVEVSPQGDVPALDPGDNAVQFECDVDPEVRARARVTIITRD